MPRLPFIFRRRGAAAIEYAIVLPVLLIMLLGIMDTGRLLWTYVTISRAADAAARCAAIRAAIPAAQMPAITPPPPLTCFSYADLRAYAVAASFGLSSITASAFTVSNPACGMQVTASYAYDSIMFRIAAPAWKTIQLSAAACYPFTAPG